MGLSAPGPPAAGTRSPWTTSRAMGLHATLLVVLPAFLGLFWWQVQRVRQGNTLSWAYVFEWPFFAAYAVYLWWHLVHEQPGLEPERAVGAVAAGAPGAREGAAAVIASRAVDGKDADTRASDGSGGLPAGRDAGGGTVPGGEARGPEVPTPTGEAAPAADREADELAAYNAYLAQLSASGRQKRW